MHVTRQFFKTTPTYILRSCLRQHFLGKAKGQVIKCVRVFVFWQCNKWTLSQIKIEGSTLPALSYQQCFLPSLGRGKWWRAKRSPSIPTRRCHHRCQPPPHLSTQDSSRNNPCLPHHRQRDPTPTKYRKKLHSGAYLALQVPKGHRTEFKINIDKFSIFKSHVQSWHMLGPKIIIAEWTVKVKSILKRTRKEYKQEAHFHICTVDGDGRVAQAPIGRV